MNISTHIIKHMVDSLMTVKDKPVECLEMIDHFRDEACRIQCFLDEQEEYFLNKPLKFTPPE
tara:strand:- start:465 stop:650 length:186 start_codon:yes stop_codon:yes gene_type:complete